jgi:hypothetical protein
VIKLGHVVVKFYRVIATDWPVIPKAKRRGSAVPCGLKGRQSSSAAWKAVSDRRATFTLHACGASGMMELDAAEWGDGQEGRVPGYRTQVVYAGYAEPGSRRQRARRPQRECP